jgi:catechol-2,3-dioxygenase
LGLGKKIDPCPAALMRGPNMMLSMRRIVLFTKDMPGMVAFYRDVLGLKLAKDEKGWKEFDANGCVIALHNGTS